MIFSHADLADLADNLYFDHGSTRILTDFLKTKKLYTKNYTDHGSTRIYTDKRKFLKSLESLDDHGFSKKLKTKN